jgi:hypothetical protein
VGGVVVAASPSAAASDATISPAAFARIDSRAARDTITSGDALVGAYRDAHGRRHIAKSYFTFDLTGYHGREVFTAGFIAPQLAAADCAKPVAVELWRTRTTTTPTWSRQPAELTRFANPNQIGCPTGQIGWDVSSTIADAVADGVEKITFVLRVSGDRQGDLAYGRTFSAAPYLRLTYNSPPDAPTDLRVDHRACGAGDIIFAPLFGSPVRLTGTVGDPDGVYGLAARVQVWDVTDPANVYEVVPGAYSGSFAMGFPNAADGHSYEWRARGEDEDGAVSAWSATCRFTVDQTRPDAPPTVASDYFVEDGGPPGVTGPGEFTFTANGVADVVGFEWSGIGVPYGSAAADQPGGSATVTIMPTSDGPLSISVHSVDAAGNRSDTRTYGFWVASNAPTTSFRNEHYFGEHVPVVLTATQADAVSFTYTWEPEDGTPEHTLPVGPDGTASLAVVIPNIGITAFDFTVWTTNADGQRSQVNVETVYLNGTEPFLYFSAVDVAVGEPVTVTVDPVFLGDVQTYRWRVDDGQEHEVVPDEDGGARFTYTPTAPGDQMFRLYATYPNGGVSGVAGQYLTVT